MSYIPVTPGGSVLVGLAANTYAEAKHRLMIDAHHMPYPNWKAFKQRGYTIEECPEIAAEYPPIWVTPHPEKDAELKRRIGK